ncbi:hypothetical protein FNH04_16235 [Streptomyces phyllanthi]|uniref:SalK n=2 Tax=Streptomyces phyllanthi TaxID=1803180 RepID=A0A5N8W1K6_9ACTN|nr:hypothetical protein [Streptomyces phyllanthi]
MHDVLEPCHVVLYYAPHVYEAFREIGLTGIWRCYFAGRAAPLGPVRAAVVTATFHHFKPSMVARVVPDVWDTAPPDEVLAARLAGVDAALRELLGDAITGEDLTEAAGLAAQAAAACAPPGRPLGAANAALDLPAAPHLALWQAATTLREYRGDGHVAALTRAEFDGVEALVTITAAGGEERENIQARRGWTDQEWAEGEQRLRERGLLYSTGALTAEGRAARTAVEDLTDRLASTPWRALGENGTRRLYELLQPLAERIVTTLRLPLPTPATTLDA